VEKQSDIEATPPEDDNLEMVRRAIAQLDSISFLDAAPEQRPRPGDGPLVRAARRVERLLGIRP
jgi:hypothetical protein